MPLPAGLRELRVESTSFEIDPSSLNWQHRLALSTVLLLAMQTEEFICKIGGSVGLDANGWPDSRLENFGPEQSFAWMPAGFNTVQMQARATVWRAVPTVRVLVVTPWTVQAVCTMRSHVLLLVHGSNGYFDFA